MFLALLREMAGLLRREEERISSRASKKSCLVLEPTFSDGAAVYRQWPGA